MLTLRAADLDPLVRHLLIGDLEPRLTPLTLDDHSGLGRSGSIGAEGRHREHASTRLARPPPLCYRLLSHTVCSSIRSGRGTRL
ncbi:Hypothetical protein AA314_08321 [Archangium gephyra]|uniref:Uncharacterized protein n=1 Tax=Archangium gephyra TaxID=48 RepID=A0AAC8QGM1_9BACT|nr:Hypothetical protein AA314_08321 [Archangium gephyra]